MDKFVVTNVSSSTDATFIKRDWITADGDDVSIPRDAPKGDWKVVVVTGDGDDAAFDGTVYFTVTGSDGSTDEIKLDASNVVASEKGYQPFGKAASDAFTVQMADVGRVSYVNLRIEATGKQTTWFLNRLELTNTANGAMSVLCFKSSLNTDYNSSAYIYPQSDYTFKVLLYTSDVKDAGFEGDVYVKAGSWWTTNDEVKLLTVDGNKSVSPARGSVVECTLKTTDVSFVSSLDVRIDPVGGSGSWSLDRIELTMEGQSWSTAYVYNDVLQAPGDKASTKLSYQYVDNYDVTLYTSADSEPFDGAVYLSLFDNGVEGSKHKLEITTPDPDAPAGGAPFMPGGKVVCSFKGIWVSSLNKAAISVEFSGSSKRWTLQRMELSNGAAFFVGTAFRWCPHLPLLYFLLYVSLPMYPRPALFDHMPFPLTLLPIT